MITPRHTRLVRAANLHAFRRAIADVVHDGRRGSRAIVVPTRGAATQARRMLGIHPGDPVEIVTRDQLYERLHARLPEPPRLLSAFERDALAQASAAANLSMRPSFQLRPGLVAEMLRFYDQLRRQSQSVRRFEELMGEALQGGDRGAERVLKQTQFLAATFREYERRAVLSGAWDEHLLRDHLISDAPADPIRHVVVTVADWIADPAGLFVADFDLLARLPGLERLDLVCTGAVLASGFHERIHNWWPGLEEVQSAGGGSRPRPVLITPGSDAGGSPVVDPPAWFTHRDREEELVAVAERRRADPSSQSEAVVYKRPLPYLYLAPDTLGAEGIAYDVSDALPLAAEPSATVVDLALEAVETSFTRDTLVALLRSPHLDLGTGAASISALDRALSEKRYLGELSHLETLADQELTGVHSDLAARAAPALAAALVAARALSPILEPAPASEQLQRLALFLTSHARPLPDADDVSALSMTNALCERERRARQTVTDLLSGLATSHAAHHDPAWTIDDLAAAVRRWIGDRTFAEAGDAAFAPVQLVDDQAGRYGDFDRVTLVGLVEDEWPERPSRNIFYGPALLKALGWPSEKDRRSGADARFVDLVGSASRQVVLSTFTLDDERVVARSTQLDEVPRAALVATVDDMVAAGDGNADMAAAGDGNAWLALRHARRPPESPEFHGDVGPLPPRTWAVSALETYLGCPFKFYAQHVLKLDEEPEDEEVMDPRRQGQFIHDVFEEFFKRWQASGQGAVTPENLGVARELFAVVVEARLARLSDAEAGLERTRMLGSPAAAGLGEAVLRMEAERPLAVVERLLEHRLKGAFTITTSAGPRVVRLSGKADRVDLLEDGTFRLIDYKLGWPPSNKARALQLPIYALCAEQRLAEERGQTWTVSEAAYLAFKGPRRVVPLFAARSDRDEILRQAEQRLADTIDAIEAGRFPPTPDDVFRCETCQFASVCRKDYVGDV